MWASRATLGLPRPAPLRAAAHMGPPAGAQRDYKVALITGANTGIGFQTAKALAEQGYYVVLGCRN